MTDQITEFVDGLPREALVAGVKAVESELDIGEEAISCPRYAIKPILEAILRAAYKESHSCPKLPLGLPRLGQSLSGDTPQ